LALSLRKEMISHKISSMRFRTHRVSSAVRRTSLHSSRPRFWETCLPEITRFRSSYGDTVQTLTFSVSAPSKTIFNYSFEEGRFRLHFDGVFPVRYEIQISSDLKTWTRLTETQGGALFPPSDPGVIIDETASTENRRFYRVQVLTP